MVTLDKIRLTGLLRKSPAQRGFSIWPPATVSWLARFPPLMGGVRWRVASLARGNVLRLFGTALVVAGALLLPGSSAGRSNESATCFGEPATIVGTPGDDTLIGT